MPKTLDIKIQIPKMISGQAAERAKSRAREAAVVSLQQEGELTIREAAAELGLTYEGYLDLLAMRGLPATQGEAGPEVLESLFQAAQQRKQ